MLRFDEAVAAVALLAGFVFHFPYVIPAWAVVLGLGATGSRVAPFQRLWSRAVAPRVGRPPIAENPRPARFAYGALAAVLVLATALWLLDLGMPAWFLALVVAAHSALQAFTGINLAVRVRPRIEHPRG